MGLVINEWICDGGLIQGVHLRKLWRNRKRTELKLDRKLNLEPRIVMMDVCVTGLRCGAVG
jgi:hypothetical protein